MPEPHRKPIDAARGTPPSQQKKRERASPVAQRPANDDPRQRELRSYADLQPTEEGIPAEGTIMATKKALIVGIDDYNDPADALTCCVNDGNAIARLLKTTHGFADIHTLRNQDATVARVGEELGWLARDAKADDRLVFYFSGNGCTRAADGIVEECLALHDGALEGSELVSATRDIAPGTLTVIIDACFTGASEEFAVDPMSSVPEVETAKVKVLKQATRDGRAKGATDGPTKVTELRRFACSAITSPPAIARMLSTSPLAARIPQEAYATMPSYAAATPNAGTAEPELNGLALLACLEHERAAANTSKTKGLSAFTHALITSVEKLGNAATTTELIAVTAERLRALGFHQTPRVMERAFPGDLKLRRFVTLEQATATETLRFLSEPRFWEGVFTALAPQLSVARAVHSREGEMMSTMYQQTANPFPQAFPPYQPTFSPSPHFQDDIQRITPLLAPVLASIIPAIVPQVVNTILAQQRTGQIGGYAGYGYAPTPSFAQQQPYVGALGTQFATDDAQRIWPVLAPVLANVIAAVLPAIVNNIVIAQQQQQQQQQRTAYGVNGPATSPELWHTVNQSVNETLQRFGAPTPNLAGFQAPFSGVAPRA